MAQPYVTEQVECVLWSALCQASGIMNILPAELENRADWSLGAAWLGREEKEKKTESYNK